MDDGASRLRTAPPLVTPPGGDGDGATAAGMFRLADVGRMSSTLVETVSLNYEDFNDSFLTCGTCLCGYDGQVSACVLWGMRGG